VKGFTDSYVAYGQTDPPSIPVAELFEPGTYPQGEILEHPGDFNTFRVTSEEKRAAERCVVVLVCVWLWCSPARGS
jgi:methionyl aminopeptidase